MKIKRLVRVPMNHAVEKVSVANVLNIIGAWASYQGACSHQKLSAPMIDPLKDLSNARDDLQLNEYGV